MRVVFLSECPGVTSSLGKVVMYMSSGLAELGFEVHVVPYSFSIIPSLVSFSRRFSPCRYAEEHGDPLSDLYPCGEVVVHPWGRFYPITEVEALRSADVLLVYSYPYVELDLNDIAYKLFTSRNKPSVLYALHEGPYLDPDVALSVLAHSVVATPTASLASKFISALSRFFERGSVEPYFTVLQHGIDVSVYTREATKRVSERYGRPVLRHDFVVGMVAKNHVRKDFATLLEAVVRARLAGYDVGAGLYWIDAVSGNYWRAEELVKRVSRKLGVDERDVEQSVYMLPSAWRGLGMPESALVHVYTSYMDMHLFLTRGEAYGLPPVETALLGVPTVTTGIPEQREIFGDVIRYVEARVVERDDIALYQPDPVDAFRAIVEFVEGKLPVPDRERLASTHDYRVVVRRLVSVIEAATQTPRALSEKARRSVARTP